MYTRLIQKADIYKKTTVTNAAGQRKPTWTIETQSAKCYFVPRFAQIRVMPTAEDTETINIFFDGATTISYGHRIYNIVDRKGNVIEAGPLEVTGVIKQTGFSGSKRHLFVTVKRVMET